MTEPLTEPFRAVHKTLYTTAAVKRRLAQYEDGRHVLIVQTPGEPRPAIGTMTSTDRPDRRVADPISVRVVEVISAVRARGPNGSAVGLIVDLVVGVIEPRSYPDTIENPLGPPTVDGTDVTGPI